MSFWGKVVVIICTLAASATVLYEQDKVHVVKVETEKIIKEAIDAYPIEFFCVIGAIVLIALLLLAECMYQAYARKKHSLKKTYTERAENQLATIA